ncbi:MAG: hypothetical protein OEZ43_10480 [Gammaproteobacteria bacterium]|nr:hypothetical protein [Gammaproteobacteria bacterium]
MSISSINAHGQVGLRAVNRRVDSHPQTHNRQTRVSSEQTKAHADREKNALLQASSVKQSRSDNTFNLDFFVADVERLKQGNNRAMHTYSQIDNYEKQQQLRRTFGVDVYV